MSDSQPDLTTATVDELWAELRSRFKTAALCYSRDGRKADTYCDGILYRGSPSEVLGVLEWGKINVTEVIRDHLDQDLIERGDGTPED